MSKRPLTEGIIRYVRPATWLQVNRDDTRELFGFDNLGGLVFAITIDHVNLTLLVAWSICRDDDNFDKAFGRTQALARLAEGKCVTMTYEPATDLISNIVINVVNRQAALLPAWGNSEEAQTQLRTLRKALESYDYTDLLADRPHPPLIKAMT